MTGDRRHDMALVEVGNGVTILDGTMTGVCEGLWRATVVDMVSQQCAPSDCSVGVAVARWHASVG